VVSLTPDRFIRGGKSHRYPINRGCIGPTVSLGTSYVPLSGFKQGFLGFPPAALLLYRPHYPYNREYKLVSYSR